MWKDLETSPEVREEVDVAELMDVWLDRKHSQFHDRQPFPSQPIPTVRVGGSGSGTRSGEGSMKQKQMIVKRNVSDSQKAEVRKDKVKMVEDLNDEIMELCILSLSNELNA